MDQKNRRWWGSWKMLETFVIFFGGPAASSSIFVTLQVEMPAKVEQMQLMDGDKPAGALADRTPGAGATPVNQGEDIAANLKTFTDSVHQKASQVVQWVQSVEGLQTETSKRFSVYKIDPKSTVSISTWIAFYWFFLRIS